MSRSELTSPFSWHQYSKILTRKIENPKNTGFFSHENAEARAMHLATGTAGEIEDGNAVKIYWLVDSHDGVIADAKFQVYGQSVLIGIAETACDLVIGKNYDQAQRMGANLIDSHLRDKSDQTAFPEDTATHLNLILDCIDGASQSCSGIPLAETYIAPSPSAPSIEGVEGGYPGWETFNTDKKLAIIEAVLTEDIRPYIEMDAGGVNLLNLLNDKEVIISYSGSCTSCYSSVGATLSYIQQVLQSKVHPDLVVVPDMENMDF
ncbi:MAG: NifU-like protein [Chlamydiales bacterium]|jgi:NifU-like protein